MFHVPEPYRLTTGPLRSLPGVGNFGAFLLPPVEGERWLLLICDDGTNPDPEVAPEMRGWEHVSVSARERERKKVRIPTWTEMAYVKNLCWDDEDVVVQFHPRKSEYVNAHAAVLHLWRHRYREFPTPPPILVGPLPEKV
jgi:hypothetical protein